MGKIVQREDEKQASSIVVQTPSPHKFTVLETAAYNPPSVQNDHAPEARIGALPQSNLEHEDPVGGWSKRAFDICVSLTGIMVLAPLLILIAIAVKLDSPGPAVFKQDRGGYRERKFRIYKFRTMTCTENSGVVQ